MFLLHLVHLYQSPDSIVPAFARHFLYRNELVVSFTMQWMQCICWIYVIYANNNFVLLIFRNFVSYSIISMSVIHSVIKIIGMIVIIRFVRWLRKSSTSEGEGEEKNKITYDPSQMSWSIGQGHQNDDVGIIGLPENISKPKPPDKVILKDQISEPSTDSSSISYAE